MKIRASVISIFTGGRPTCWNKTRVIQQLFFSPLIWNEKDLIWKRNNFFFMFSTFRCRSSSSQSWQLSESYLLFGTARWWVSLLQCVHIQKLLSHIQIGRGKGTGNRRWSYCLDHLYIGRKYSNASGKMQEKFSYCSCIFWYWNEGNINIWRCD